MTFSWQYISRDSNMFHIFAVSWIRIRMDPDLLRLRIQQKIKEKISKNLIYNFRPVKCGCVSCRTVVWNTKRLIVGEFFLLINFKVRFFNTFQICLNNMDWIRICIWIRTRNSKNGVAGSGSGINHSVSTTDIFGSLPCLSSPLGLI